MAKSSGKRLAAFDFDYTIVLQNTDTVVRDLLPPEHLPKDLNSIIAASGWTEYMAEVFRLLHQHSISPEKVRDTIRAIPEVPGFVRLLKRLRQEHNFDVVIISDSNSVFIQEWLEAHGLGGCVQRVFTNPARFEEGLLTIEPYESQTSCRLSAPNLCKGKVLEHFLMGQDLRHNLRYERVVYVGDGNNDLCPVRRLRSADLACARAGFPLDHHLQKPTERRKVRAEVVIWKDGFELLETITAQLDKTAPEKTDPPQ